MAILCLADDMKDLKERLGKIIVAYTVSGEPVTAARAESSRSYGGASEGRDQTEYDPDAGAYAGDLVHGGPFANIAHGCNSVRATKTAL